MSDVKSILGGLNTFHSECVSHLYNLNTEITSKTTVQLPHVMATFFGRANLSERTLKETYFFIIILFAFNLQYFLINETTLFEDLIDQNFLGQACLFCDVRIRRIHLCDRWTDTYWIYCKSGTI